MMTLVDEGKPRRRVKKRIVLGELNVVTHPHSPEQYVATFKALCAERVQVLYHGQRYLEIGTCRDLNDPRLPDAIAGYLFVFSKIDFQDPWLNTLRNAEATEDELAQINIPANLAPEFRRFRYVFDVHRHRLFYEKRSSLQRHHLSPKAVRYAIDLLLHTPVGFHGFEEANAFTVADKNAVEAILTLNKLRKLYIEVHRPNPDDDEFDEEILAALNGQNASSEERTLIKAPRTDALHPNTFTKKLARLAARMGSVIGWGKNADGAAVVEATEQHPVDHTVTFDDTQSVTDRIVENIAEVGTAIAQDSPPPLIGGDG